MSDMFEPIILPDRHEHCRAEITRLTQQLAAAQAAVNSVRNYCEARGGEFLRIVKMIGDIRE